MVNEETLVTVVPAQARVLFFTSNRLIVANVEVTAWINVLYVFAMIGGLIIGLVRARTRAKKTEKLSKLSPESILTADKKNFGISYAEISNVKLFKRGRGRKIRVTAGAAKHEFWLSQPKEFENYVNVLRPVLAEKLAVS
ncbi:MAG: hypothetical protein V3U26_02245 [Dehalococcoidia bacterium]